MTFKKSYYCDNNNLAIIAFEESGETFGVLTVNIDKLPENFAALDTNNFPNAEMEAKELGAIPTGQTAYSGFCAYPIYNFAYTNIPMIEG